MRGRRQAQLSHDLLATAEKGLSVWVKLDDRFPRHRRVRQLRRDVAAKWLHVVALCHCAENLTDGLVDEIALDQIISDADVPKAAAKRCVPKLVDAGLWIPHDGGGFLIRDFLDYNPTAADVKEKREKRAAAGRLGGLRSGEARREANASPDAFALGSLPVEPRARTRPYSLSTSTLTPVAEAVDNSLRQAGHQAGHG